MSAPSPSLPFRPDPSRADIVLQEAGKARVVRLNDAADVAELLNLLERLRGCVSGQDLSPA